MLKKIKKILILSLMATMLTHAEGENGSGSNNTEIDEIIRKSESERIRKEQREIEREERRRAREEERARKKAEKEAEKAARDAEKNSNYEIPETITNTQTPLKNQGEKHINNNMDINTNTNTRYNNVNNENSSNKDGQNVTTQGITENPQLDSEINQILNQKKKEKPKSKIDKSKPVVMAEDREKETGNQYRDALMKYIGTKDGRVLKKENETKIHPIASLTKVMNIIVALDQIDKGNAKLEERVCFSAENANLGGSWLNVRPGDCFMLKDLLRAQIIYSANNASYLVAKHIGKGNVDNFVKLMNEKAAELGMKNTVFHTPAGLPTSMTGKGMDVSTAYDMFLLGKKAIEDKRIREWANEPELILLNDKGEQVVYPSRNHLLGSHGIYGLKTGFHNLAGFNIIVSSQIGNIEIISVVLGHVSDRARTSDQKKEFSDIEKEIKVVYPIGYEIGYFKIRDAVKKKILGILSDNIYQFNGTNYEFKIKQLKLKAEKEGIKKGDIIGKLEVLSEGKVISEVDVLAIEDVKQLSLLGRIIRFVTFGLV